MHEGEIELAVLRSVMIVSGGQCVWGTVDAGERTAKKL